MSASSRTAVISIPATNSICASAHDALADYLGAALNSRLGEMSAKAVEVSCSSCGANPRASPRR